MLIEDNKVLIEAIASTDISEGQALYISNPGQVAPGIDAYASKVIGIANNSAASGEKVQVITFGLTSVVADGAVNVGDCVVLASTAGRVVANNASGCNEVLGKAWGSASAAGDSLLILVHV